MKKEELFEHYKLLFDEDMHSYKEEWLSPRLQNFPFRAYIRSSEEEGICPCHWHELFEIDTIIRGVIRYDINGQQLIARPDDMIIVQPGLTHSWEIVSDPPVEMLVIQFSPKIINPSIWNTIEAKFFISFFNNSDSTPGFIDDVKTNYPDLFVIVNKIYEEYIGKKSGREILMLGYVLEFIAYLVRENLIRNIEDENEKDIGKILPLLKYIEDNYQSKISLEDAAKILNYDYYYASKIFKRLTKKTFIEYLDNVRIKEAEKLIITKNMALAEVALSVGFENLSSFNRAFKRVKSITPSEFMQNVKEDG